MKRNFRLFSEVIIDHEGSLIDLHNDYGFHGINYVIGRELRLLWKPLCDELQFVFIEFRGITWLRIESIDSLARVDENICMDFMGFLHPDDTEVMDGFLFEDHASSEHHLILRFNGGLAIRVNADTVEVVRKNRDAESVI